MFRQLFAVPLIYILLLTFASCGNKNYHNSGAVWGTTYHISYSAPQDLSDSVIAVMNDIDRQFSMFLDSSVVSRINRNEDVAVNGDFIKVFELSKRLSELSGGAFDPTVGPLTDLWGFGIADFDSVPSEAAIDSVLTSVGISDCRVVGNKVIKKNPSTRFDFSSIAKGYGVDAVGAMLARNGCTDFLVEIGGEILTRGLNPRGLPWRVQIDAPQSGIDSHTAMTVIDLPDAAVATSGNYRNYRESGGRRFGHTLDPHSGYPVETSTLSATVIAPDCATADGLATACMVMDVSDALAMIESLDSIEALIVVAAGDSIAMRSTTNFPSFSHF